MGSDQSQAVSSVGRGGSLRFTQELSPKSVYSNSLSLPLPNYWEQWAPWALESRDLSRGQPSGAVEQPCADHRGGWDAEGRRMQDWPGIGFPWVILSGSVQQFSRAGKTLTDPQLRVCINDFRSKWQPAFSCQVPQARPAPAWAEQNQEMEFLGHAEGLSHCKGTFWLSASALGPRESQELQGTWVQGSHPRSATYYLELS